MTNDMQTEDTGTIAVAFLPEILDDPAMTTEGLLDYWADLTDTQTRLGKWKWQIEARIAKSMADNRAEVAESQFTKATFKGSMETDLVALEALKEYLSPEEWDAHLTAERPPPARKPHLTKIKALVKRGDPFRSIIEGAQSMGLPQLKLRRKEQADGR